MQSVFSYPISQRASQRTGDLQALREESAKRPTAPPMNSVEKQKQHERLLTAPWGRLAATK